MDRTVHIMREYLLLVSSKVKQKYKYSLYGYTVHQ